MDCKNIMQNNVLKTPKITIIKLFITISFIGIAFFMFTSIILGNISFKWLMLENDTSHMAIDYYNHVLFAADPQNLYVNVRNTWGAEWACFPPLAYMFYMVLYRFTSFVELTPTDWIAMKQIDEASTVFLYYSILIAIGLLFSLLIWNKKLKLVDILFFYLCLIFSVPFFTGFERGNTCMIVLVLLLVMLKWKDSESAVKREIALILIAICSGIKIYPAIFGFLFIKEKRWRECLRLIIYGILFFFTPFLFFGGINGFSQWCSNIQNTMVVDSLGRIEYIRGLVIILSYVMFGTTADYASLVLPNVFLIAMLVLSFISADKYRTIFYLCSIMTFYPSNAFRYTLCYLSIPLIMYIMEHGNEKVSNTFVLSEIVGYALLFSIPTLWGLCTDFNYRFAISQHLTYVELWIYTVAYLLIGVITIHEIYEIIYLNRYNINLKKRISFPNK